MLDHDVLHYKRWLLPFRLASDFYLIRNLSKFKTVKMAQRHLWVFRWLLTENLSKRETRNIALDINLIIIKTFEAIGLALLHFFFCSSLNHSSQLSHEKNSIYSQNRSCCSSLSCAFLSQIFSDLRENEERKWNNGGVITRL